MTLARAYRRGYDLGLRHGLTVGYLTGFAVALFAGCVARKVSR